MTAIANTMSKLSLYIPHVFPNITEKRIVNIFNKLLLGQVSSVDLVPKTDREGKQFNAAYIHFDYWYDNVAARNFQQKVVDDKQDARLVYDDPWFWVVLENKKNLQLEDEYEQEDEELEQILNEMDDCEEQMIASVYSKEYTANDYAAEKTMECEQLRKKIEKQRRQIKDLEDSRFQAREDAAFFEAKSEEQYIKYLQNRKDMEDYIYINESLDVQNRMLLQERIELATELAHFKEVLAQYEPDVKKQNKELYH
jgi:hypothetical protein